MSKEVLHALIDKVDETEEGMVLFILSRIVKSPLMDEDGVEIVVPLPDELEIIKEYDEAMARGEELYSHEEVWGEIEKNKKREREKVAI